jgi:DNA-binding winged helix-turn-helix (wHTH) protein
MNDHALKDHAGANVQVPLESLRFTRIMLIAALLSEVGPLEAALRAAGAVTERVHPRDKWRWLFFETRPQLLIAYVSEDEEGGGLTPDALAEADLIEHAPVVALTLPSTPAPTAGVSTSLLATARPEAVAAQAAQLLAPDMPTTTLRVGDVALDADGASVWVAGRSVPLTPTEYALLAYLLTNRSRVLTYERILTDVWPMGDAPSIRGLAVHFTRLRAKLTGAPGVRLSVMRGVGYCLDLPASV